MRASGKFWSGWFSVHFWISLAQGDTVGEFRRKECPGSLVSRVQLLDDIGTTQPWLRNVTDGQDVKMGRPERDMACGVVAGRG